MDLDDLLKSIREEGPSKGGSISPAKFFGEDRYETYLQEITSSGTVDGEQLSPSDRKEAFKKRNDKIGFQNFVDKVLEKKKSKTYTEESKSQKSLPGGGAIVKSPKPSLANFIKPAKSEEIGESENNQEILKDILKNIISIRESLGNQKKLEDKGNKKEQKDSEKEKRSKKENKLESNVFKGIKNSISKVLAPVKGMFDKILTYLSTVFLGAIAVKIFDWFTDDKNKEKISSVFRFIKDWWPSLLGALILFGGALLGPIGLIAGITALSMLFIPKLIDATKQLLGFGSQTEDDAKKAEKDLKAAGDDINVDSMLPEELKEADKKLEETKNLKEPVQMKNGGSVPGSGPNKDTVPAMLSPGEFVMSRGAVQKFGTGALASMNTMGGGTNRPMISNGTLYASSGGEVPENKEPGGKNNVKPEPSNEGQAWWDFMGWAGTGNKTSMNEKTPKESSSSSGGGFNESSLKAAMDKAGYTDPTERAMFLAQMAHESGNFKYDEEIHDGSNYEGRSDLGNTQPGDGKRYKGRGYIQLTGRANYTHYGKKLGVDLAGNPELAKKPDIAADVAVAYWKERVNREAARKGDVKTVTKNINGGYNGLQDRIDKFKKYSGNPNYSAPGGGSIASSSGGSSSIASSSSSSGAGSITSATQKPKISPPTLQSATATISNLRDMINSDFMESPESGIAAGNDIPEFAADAMNSINKIKTLGVV
jgi:predicted chitinase